MDNGKKYYYLKESDVTVKGLWKLPDGISCDGGCLFQWWWLGYQHCAMPCEADDVEGKDEGIGECMECREW